MSRWMDFSDETNDAVESQTTIESAFDSLLESRNTLLMSNPIVDDVLSEEDVLCNRNLQTSFLFKTLNDSYRKLNKEIEALVEDDKSLDDSSSKFKNSHSTLLYLCKTYQNHSTDTIHKSYMELAKDYNEVQGTIRKEIMTKRSALEKELDIVSTKLNSIRKLILTGIEELVKPDDMTKKMCPVCFEREVCMVMVPCGHTYCDACSKYDYRAKCPQCRQTINSRVKMFFSM